MSLENQSLFIGVNELVFMSQLRYILLQKLSINLVKEIHYIYDIGINTTITNI